MRWGERNDAMRSATPNARVWTCFPSSLFVCSLRPLRTLILFYNHHAQKVLARLTPYFTE